MNVSPPPTPALETARGAEFPPTCQVRFLREEGKPLRVMADLPRGRNLSGGKWWVLSPQSKPIAGAGGSSPSTPPSSSSGGDYGGGY